MTSESEYHLTSGTEDDWEQINDLYFQISGRKRSREQFNWEWLNTADGTGSMWTILERPTGRIIGHHGMIPIPIHVSGRTLLAGKTENTMVHPDFRKKIYYPSFERMALSDAKKRYQVMFTTAGRGAPGMIRTRMGYELLGNWCLYLLNASPAYQRAMFTQQSISSGYRKYIPPSVMSGLFRVYHTIRNPFRIIANGFNLNKINEINKFIDAMASFWKNNRQYYGITIDRNIKYLKWRIEQNPYNKYKLYEFQDSKGIAGYAILREKIEKNNPKSFVKHFIDDFIVRNNDWKLYKRCIDLLIKRLKESDLLTCRTVYLDDSFNKALQFCQLYPWRSMSKRAVENSSPFLVYYNTEVTSKKWFITELLTEGVL